jgi:FixJ family two-component response regulator
MMLNATFKKVSKLTEKDVQEIRRRVRLGELHRVIAKDFGVSRGHVGDIANGDKWGWLEEP